MLYGVMCFREATDLPKLEVSDISVSDPVVVTQDSVVQANNTSQTSDQGGSSETNSNENSEEAGLYLAENPLLLKPIQQQSQEIHWFLRVLNI